MFTTRLHQDGYRMVWCDEALVADVVPATRANRRWVLQRAVRSGNASSRVAILVARSRMEELKIRAVLVGRGAARIVGGSLRVALGTVTRSLVHRARGSRSVARGIGMAAGAVGYTREEYKRA
jgi:hypothetical protein